MKKTVKTLYSNYWINLKQTSRGFVYAERKGVNSTAILLFRKQDNKYSFLLRYQPLPMIEINEAKNISWQDLYPCCVTGSIEKNETPVQNAVKEVWEETNYIVTTKNIRASKIMVATTQMNECVYTFVMDISGAKKANKKLGDNSIFENISQNKWVSYKELKNILLNKNNLYLSSLASAFLLFEAKCK